MSLTLANGTTIAFDRLGPADAPLVVLLHGLSGARTTYAPVVSHLAARSGSEAVQIVAADLRGHGESSHGGPYDAATYAYDIASLIESFGAGPAFVVGHSLGGVVAATLAAVRADVARAVFLEDPPLYEGDDVRRNASPVATFFPLQVKAVRERQARNAPAADYFELSPPFTPPHLLEARARALSGWDPATMEAAIDGKVWSTYNPIVRIPCPVTVVRADPSAGAVFEAGDVEPFLAANPHANVVMVERAPHGVHDSELAAYLSHLDTFLAAHAG